MYIYQNIIHMVKRLRRLATAEDMAMEMLATTIGLPDDLSLTWDQREEQWKLSGKIYKTNNFTQSAEGDKDGLWTTVLSAALMILAM
jgi:arginine decarboxylase